MVRYLIAEGASPALANDKNYIPLDLASFGEKTNVVDYFLSQMDELETKEGADGLGSAAAAMDLDGKDAGEVGKAEDDAVAVEGTEKATPSGHSS